ncbi:MAG: ornithine carbamoyltransferase [Victivallaceae bacterium]
MFRNLLTVEDVSCEELYKIFNLAAKLKRERECSNYFPLQGKSVGMIFAKSSTRTRVSFEVGIRELGGSPLYLDQGKLQMERGESIADTARVLSRYLHAIVIRTYHQSEIVELAKHATIPVINALTNEYHPCQILADLFTVYEYSEKLENVKLVFCGDGRSNVANSLITACKMTGMNLVVAAPEGFNPAQAILDADIGTGSAVWEKDPVKAVENADYIYTDVWVSMGFEKETESRTRQLQPYQVNSELIDAASADVRVLHCLPAHRGMEITDEVMDSHRSIVFDQAENRLHVQKAILALLFENE